jgi:hypothetical protein
LGVEQVFKQPLTFAEILAAPSFLDFGGLPTDVRSRRDPPSNDD